MNIVMFTHSFVDVALLLLPPKADIFHHLKVLPLIESITKFTDYKAIKVWLTEEV